MNAREYYQSIQTVINGRRIIIASNMSFNEIDTNECYIRGMLTLINDFELHIAEYVVTAPTLERIKYRYHLQKKSATLISRWDNVPHHRQVSSFPHHRHDADQKVHESPAMDIVSVLKAVVPLILDET